MTSQDDILTDKYKKMIGLDNIINTSGNTIIIGSATIASNLNVSGNTILQGDASINSSLYVSGNSLIYGNTTVNSSVNILGTSTFGGNVTVLSDIYVNTDLTVGSNLLVSATSIIQGSVSVLNNLNVSGMCICNGTIDVKNIYPINNNIEIYADNITIGNPNSIVNIIGTTNYIANTDLIVVDKMISLNLNASTGSGFDIGNSSGIEILGTSGVGYIKTTSDATRYEIVAPANVSQVGYIATLDINNNLVVTGSTLLYKDVTINSSLYVSSSTIIKGSTSFNSNLYISGNSIINGSTTVLSSLFVSGTTNISGNTTIKSNLNVSGNSVILYDSNISGNLTVNNNSIFNNNVSIMNNFYVSGNSIINGMTTINSSLNISGNAIIQNSLTVNSNLYVGGTATIINSSTILSNMSVSNNTIINGATTFGSNLFISGSSYIQGNATFGNTLSYFNILGKIISQLKEYPDNTSAKNGGIPVWGFYRTGGIIKVRLNDVSPILTLSGNSSISIQLNSNYTEPGVLALDYTSKKLQPYLSTIKDSNNTNYLTVPIALNTATTTLITSTSTLPSKMYTLNYTATDEFGNIGSISRSLAVIGPSMFINGSTSIYTCSIICYTSIYPTVVYNTSATTISNTYSTPNTYNVGPNTWYLVNTALSNKFNFNNSGSSWTLSPSYLSLIGFNPTSNWCFVFKAKKLDNSEARDFMQLCADTDYSIITSVAAGQDYGNVTISLNLNNNTNNYDMIYSSYDSMSTTTIPTSTLINNSLYYIFTYNSTTKALTLSIYLSLSSAPIFTATKSNYTVTKTVPFHMYMNNSTYAVENGIYYSSILPINLTTVASYY